MLEVQSGIRDDSRENVRLLTEIMGMQRRPMRPQIGAQGERAK
jgi:glycine cleavage system protein P-like pyridoxal-binding family